MTFLKVSEIGRALSPLSSSNRVAFPGWNLGGRCVTRIAPHDDHGQGRRSHGESRTTQEPDLLSCSPAGLMI